MSSPFKKGDRVDVDLLKADKDTLTAAAKRLKVKSLRGTVLTGEDPCCGCHIVQFDTRIGTSDVYFTSGKKGYIEEVPPSAMTKAKGRKPKVKDVPEDEVEDTAPKKADMFEPGTAVEVVKDNSSYGEVRVGDVGVVVKVEGDRYGVRWERSTEGKHTLTGNVDPDYGYWVPKDMVKKVSRLRLPVLSLKSFSEGDRVIVVAKGDPGFEGQPVGGVGTVMAKTDDVGIKFDKPFGHGHNLGFMRGAADDKLGYWVQPKDLIILKHSVKAVDEVKAPKAKAIPGDRVVSVTVDLQARTYTQEGYPVSPSNGYSGTLVYRGGSRAYVIIPFGGKSGSLVFEPGDERIVVHE